MPENSQEDPDVDQYRDKNNTTRRAAMRSIGLAGIATSGLTGTAAADNEPIAENEKKHAGSNSHTMRVSPENAMSDKEADKATNRILEKYGAGAALETFPERASDELEDEFTSETVTPTVGDGGIREGVTRIDTWSHAYDVENSFNQTIAETDHFITLFEADETDANGDTVYFWRGYNYSEAKDDAGGRYATTSMTAEIQFRRDQMEFNQYEPDTKEQFDSSSDTLTISLGFAEVGSSFGGSSGYQQPDPSEIELGYGEEPPAEYEDEWNPNHNGAQFGYEVGGCLTGLATGSFVLDTRSPGPWGFWWRTTVDAALAQPCTVTS